MSSTKLMVSSTSRNSDHRRRSSSSSSTKSSSISDFHNQNTANENSLASMTFDNALLDGEITLLDAAGAVTGISDNEANGSGAPSIRRQESVSNSVTKMVRRL